MRFGEDEKRKILVKLLVRRKRIIAHGRVDGRELYTQKNDWIKFIQIHSTQCILTVHFRSMEFRLNSVTVIVVVWWWCRRHKPPHSNDAYERNLNQCHQCIYTDSDRIWTESQGTKVNDNTRNYSQSALDGMYLNEADWVILLSVSFRLCTIVQANTGAGSVYRIDSKRKNRKSLILNGKMLRRQLVYDGSEIVGMCPLFITSENRCDVFNWRLSASAAAAVAAIYTLVNPSNRRADHRLCPIGKPHIVFSNPKMEEICMRFNRLVERNTTHISQAKTYAHTRGRRISPSDRKYSRETNEMKKNLNSFAHSRPYHPQPTRQMVLIKQKNGPKMNVECVCVWNWSDGKEESKLLPQTSEETVDIDRDTNETVFFFLLFLNIYVYKIREHTHQADRRDSHSSLERIRTCEPYPSTHVRSLYTCIHCLPLHKNFQRTQSVIRPSLKPNNRKQAKKKGKTSGERKENRTKKKKLYIIGPHSPHVQVHVHEKWNEIYIKWKNECKRTHMHTIGGQRCRSARIYTDQTSLIEFTIFGHFIRFT